MDVRRAKDRRGEAGQERGSRCRNQQWQELHGQIESWLPAFRQVGAADKARMLPRSRSK
jgi:hypothetical protein